MLMGALMGAIAAVGQDRRMLEHLEGVSSIAGDAAVELIATDFQNGRRMWPVQGGGVIITGYCGISRNTLQNDNRLARVVYTVIEGDLVRVQEYLDDGTKSQRWTEIVARNVTGFHIQRVPTIAEMNLQLPPFTPIPLERALMDIRGATSMAGQSITPTVMLTLAFDGQPPGTPTSAQILVR